MGDQRTPTVSQMQAVLQRLHATLGKDGPSRNELLETEMTLRGMMPELEARLQETFDEQHGSDGAVQALMDLSSGLMWIQFHARAPDSELRGRLETLVSCAQQIVRCIGP